MMDYSLSSWAMTMCHNSLSFNAVRAWNILEFHPLEITLDPANSLCTELITANIREKVAKIFKDEVPVIYLKYAN